MLSSLTMVSKPFIKPYGHQTTFDDNGSELHRYSEISRTETVYWAVYLCKLPLTAGIWPMWSMEINNFRIKADVIDFDEGVTEL